MTKRHESYLAHVSLRLSALQKRELLATPGPVMSLFGQSLLEKVSCQVKEDSFISSSLSLAMLAKSGSLDRSSGGAVQGAEWNGICCLGQRPSAGTSKVIQRRQKEERKRNKIEREKSIQQNLLRQQLAASQAPSRRQRLDIEGGRRVRVLPATLRHWSFLVPALQATGRDTLLPLVAAELSRVAVAEACLLRRMPVRVCGSGSHVPVPKQSEVVCRSTGRCVVTGARNLGWWRCCSGDTGSLPLRSSIVLGSHPFSFIQPLVHQGQSSGLGSSFSCGEGGSRASPPSLSRLLQPIVCSDEGLRVVEASHRPFHSEPSRPQVSVQDGDSPVYASGDWMVSLDLKDAYLQIPIHPDSRKYLRFVAFERVYQFKSVFWSLHGPSSRHEGHGSGIDFSSS